MIAPWRSRKLHATEVNAIDPTMRAFRVAAAEAQRSRLPQMAAALSYRTIFGMIPILVVALVLVKSMTGPEAQAQLLKDATKFAGLNTIFVKESGLHLSARPNEPAPSGGATVQTADLMGPPVTEEVLARLEGEAPELDAWISAMVERAQSSVQFGVIGWIGFATLVYAAIGMLVEIERAFNQIFRVPQGRSWVRRVTNYWSLLTLGTIGLVATFYVGAKFQDWAKHIVAIRGWEIGSGALTAGLIGFAVTVAISTLFLTVIYETVPNTRVKPMPALGGAFIAAVLWEAGKWGFAEYLEYSHSYARLYGSLALVPLFLLWVYVCWFIVLFGLAVTYQLQYGRFKIAAQPFSELGPSIIDPAAGLVVMSALARAFATGRTRTATDLADETKLPVGIVALVLGTMSERGLTHRLDRPDMPNSEPAYTLARPPDSIPVDQVLQIGFELTGSQSGPEVAGSDGGVRQQFRQAQLDAAKGRSLASIAVPPPVPENSLVRPPSAEPAPAARPQVS